MESVLCDLVGRPDVGCALPMTRKLLAELRAEIKLHPRKHGTGVQDLHVGHERSDWNIFIREKVLGLDDCTPQEWRYRMLQIASLACQAIESV